MLCSLAGDEIRVCKNVAFVRLHFMEKYGSRCEDRMSVASSSIHSGSDTGYNSPPTRSNP